MLYLRCESCEANPKVISGRTSYLRVRLAFHPYPQVIQNVFNRFWFGPSRAVTPASPCPWIAHPVSGLSPATKRPIKTRFPYGSGVHRLNLTLPKTTRRSVLQKVRRHPIDRAPTDCKRTVSDLFHSGFPGSFHLSLTVLVHYRSLMVFSLGWWSTQIHAEFHVFRVTWEQSQSASSFRLRGCYPLWPDFPELFD